MDKKMKNLIIRAVLVVAFLLISMLLGKLAGGSDNGGQQVEQVVTSSAEQSSETYVASSERSESSEAIVIESSATESVEASIEESEVGSSETIAESSSVYDDEDEDDDQKPDSGNQNDPEGPSGQLDPYGSYYSKDDVSLYLYTYGELPDNYITKSEAENLGWSGGKVEPYAPGKVIGGDKFGNKEKLLPTKKGRQYYECDIDTLGKKRGEKRIVFSNDGLIYYTDDHYESFTLLYGEP